MKAKSIKRHNPGSLKNRIESLDSGYFKLTKMEKRIMGIKKKTIINSRDTVDKVRRKGQFDLALIITKLNTTKELIDQQAKSWTNFIS